ncbi:MFS transporter [Castellaniella sp. S9]|uniref:MFS transporter n=1 Tax=Castellaniella sp. S9 TaxID=2993652 RepID=UPI0022B3CF0D|nr:MFS transporter [Castellaniella sp. S9]
MILRARPDGYPDQGVESPYAWIRLLITLTAVTIGNVGMYAASIVLPSIEADFGVSRSGASLPYAVTMIGFGIGGIVMGRLADRFGVFVPLVISALGLGVGFFLAGMADGIGTFNLVHGVFIGLLGSSATFAPLVADASHWFTRRRGIAVAICMSGNYLAGAVWPPVMQYFVGEIGWRQTYAGIGVFCAISLLPLAVCLRRRAPSTELPLPDTGLAAAPASRPDAGDKDRPLGLSPNTLLALLCVAGVGCCVAMAMPQVQIVAYCSDLGYGATNGANMLSLMLAMGIISRLSFGWLSDRIGGLCTLLVGSLLQGLALWLYLLSHGLLSLYVISALFGLFQGGIVPAYAVIVREYFPREGTGVRVGTVLMATLVGMALGGWMSGAIYDLSLSYRAAFINGIAWNVLNAAIVLFLVMRARRVRLLRLAA